MASAKVSGINQEIIVNLAKASNILPWYLTIYISNCYIIRRTGMTGAWQTSWSVHLEDQHRHQADCDETQRAGKKIIS